MVQLTFTKIVLDMCLLGRISTWLVLDVLGARISSRIVGDMMLLGRICPWLVLDMLNDRIYTRIVVEALLLPTSTMK